MKFYIDLSKGKLDLEYEPMSREKFFAICYCITICVVATAFFGIFK